MSGNADPRQMVEQHGKLREKLSDARTKGAAEAGAPMGEERLFPKTSGEKLSATVKPGAVRTGHLGRGEEAARWQNAQSQTMALTEPA